MSATWNKLGSPWAGGQYFQLRLRAAWTDESSGVAYPGVICCAAVRRSERGVWHWSADHLHRTEDSYGHGTAQTLEDAKTLAVAAIPAGFRHLLEDHGG